MAAESWPYLPGHQPVYSGASVGGVCGASSVKSDEGMADGKSSTRFYDISDHVGVSTQWEVLPAPAKNIYDILDRLQLGRSVR